MTTSTAFNPLKYYHSIYITCQKCSWNKLTMKSFVHPNEMTDDMDVINYGAVGSQIFETHSLIGT